MVEMKAGGQLMMVEMKAETKAKTKAEKPVEMHIVTNDLALRADGAAIQANLDGWWPGAYRATRTGELSVMATLYIDHG